MWFVLFSYISLSIISFIFLILIYFKHCYGHWKRHGIVFAKPSIPFGNFGDFASGKKHLGPVALELYNKYKKCGQSFVGIYIFAEPVVMPIDPELIKIILMRDFNHFNSRGMYLNEENDPLSAHMIAQHGTKWKNVRGKLSPAFSGSKLKTLFPTLEIVVDKLVNLLEEKSKFSEPVEIKELMSQYTTDAIGSCILGIECNSMRDPDDHLRKSGKRFFKTETLHDIVRCVCAMNYPKWMTVLGFRFAPNEVEEYFNKAIKDIVVYREKNGVERKDFMQVLLQLKNKGTLDDVKDSDSGFKFTLNDISAQCLGFFMAGFDTSSATLAFIWYEISKNPRVQEKIRKEIIAVLETTNGKLDHDSLSKLTYLDQVVTETLRKYPTVPVLNRECSQDYKIPGYNYTVKKGQRVYVPVMGLQRDPEYYPDPETFDPDRFNPENKSENLPYMPFGDGPRYCVGKRFALMQVKLAVASVIRKFSVSLNPKTVEPIGYDPKNFVIMCPENDVFLDFVKL